MTGLGLDGPAYWPTSDPRDLYHNLLVALDATRSLNNGLPGSLARWIQALDLNTGDRVFHLGCGVGYYTAIMAEVVGPDGSVVACEVDSDLAARARENLASYPNVTVHAGDGAAFDPDACDAILINAGVTHPHRPWLERLRVGGSLVLPLTVATAGTTAGNGVMARIVRKEDGFSAGVVTFVAIYSCASARDPQLEPLLAKAIASRALLKMKSVRQEPHEQSDGCLLHGREVCLSCVASPSS